MLRRVIVVGVLGLAVSASPALASLHFNSQMRQGVATASRTSNSKCSFAAGSVAGSLRITCTKGGQAHVTYRFAAGHPVTGTPSSGVAVTTGGASSVHRSVTVGGSTLRMTVTVSGAGNAQVNTVSVGYYTR
jgi:hypothetical protein